MEDFTYADWTRSTKTVDAFAAYEETKAVLSTPDGPSRVDGITATSMYFSIFGVRPIIGRTFDSTEALPGAPQVVVLGERLWRERFGGDSSIVGRTMSFDGARRAVGSASSPCGSRWVRVAGE